MVEQAKHMAHLNQLAESQVSASEEITATLIECSGRAEDTRREVDKFEV